MFNARMTHAASQEKAANRHDQAEMRCCTTVPNIIEIKRTKTQRWICAVQNVQMQPRCHDNGLGLASTLLEGRASSDLEGNGRGVHWVKATILQVHSNAPSISLTNIYELHPITSNYYAKTWQNYVCWNSCRAFLTHATHVLTSY